MGRKPRYSQTTSKISSTFIFNDTPAELKIASSHATAVILTEYYIQSLYLLNTVSNEHVFSNVRNTNYRYVCKNVGSKSETLSNK